MIKSNRNDGVLSPEELEKAIAEYKQRHAQEEQHDNEEVKPEETPIPAKAQEYAEDVLAVPEEEKKNPVEAIREEHEKRAEDGGDVDDLETLKGTSQRQDEDIQTLLDIIDSLLAERDFKGGAVADDCATEKLDSEDEPAEAGKEELTEEEHQDEDDAGVPAPTKVDTQPAEKVNMDSAEAIDAIVRERVKIGIAADKLHLDGIENLSMTDAKKAIIKAVRPTMNFDGKSRTYIDAAFGMAMDDMNAANRKDTNYQRKQMFNKDAGDVLKTAISDANKARERMVSRMNKTNKED